MTSIQIQELIIKRKTDVEESQQGLASISKQRAEIRVELDTQDMDHDRKAQLGRTLAELNENAREIENFLMDSPAYLAELDNKLQEAMNHEAEIEKIVPKQQKIVEKIIKLSKALVESLKQPVELNQQLNQLYVEYNSLKTQTQQDLLPDTGIIGPSQQMLSVVADVLQRELAGEDAASLRNIQIPLRV